MTSHDNDSAIDFKKLERELDNAVEADAKYWRENDAKFRAVRQKVASYDEFRDIVLASNIKPLEEKDRISNITFVQPWNSQAVKKELNADKADHSEIPKGKEYPTTSQAFVREWRRINIDVNEQYNFLLELGGERLEHIFKTEIGFGLLGEFAKCFNCMLKEDGVDCVVTILGYLSTTNRFTLTVQFLSAKEKEDLSGVFVKLKDFAGNADKERKASLEDEIERLMRVYEIKK